MKFSKFFPYSEDRTFSILVCIVLFVPLVFSHITFEKFETIKLALLSVLTGAALIFIKKIRFNKSSLICLGSFLFFGLLATVFSPDIIYSIFGKDYIWMGLYFFILWSVFVAMLVSELTQERLLFLFKVLIVVGLANSIVSILQTYGIGVYYDVYLIGYLIRPPGLMGNPNFSAMFFASTLILAVYFWFESSNLKLKIYYALASFFLIWATMMVSSRGAILGMAASIFSAFVLIVWLKNRRSMKYLAITGFIFLILYIFFVPLIRDSDIPGLPGINDTNIVTRIDTWSDALAIIIKHPATGIGWGNHDEVHNIALNFLVIGGLPLLLSFLSIFIVPFWFAYKKYKHWRQADPGSWIDVALISALIGFFVSACFNPVSTSVWVMVGVLVAGLCFRFTPATQVASIPRAFSIIAGGILIVGGISFFTAQTFLFYGLRAESNKSYSSSYKLFNLSRAFDPFSGVLQANLAWDEIGLGLQPATSVQTISKIAKLHPDDEWSYIRTGILYHHLYDQTSEQQYLDKSFQNLQHAIDLNPFRYGANTAAYYAFEEKNYNLAFEFTDQSLMGTDYYRDDTFNWMLLENIYYLRGNKVAAGSAIAKAYDSAIEAANNDINPQKYFLRHILDDFSKKGQLQKVPLTPDPDFNLMF